jgi:hypothetical protein
MDFEDYALGGVGAGAGLALGGGVIGKYIGDKWGEDAYYRSKARSLGKESDASVDYDQQSRALLESNLPEKQKIRELQKLKVQRDRVIGDSTRNRESDAEVSRWLNKAKGIGVGTLGAGAVGGAIGLGYGLNNDFSGDKQHFANFNNYDSLALGTLGLTTGLLAPIALDLKYNKYSPEEQAKVDKSEKYLNTLRYRLNKKYPPSNDSASNDKEYYNEFYNLSDKYLDKSGAKEVYRRSSNKSNIATGLGLAAGVAGGVGGVIAGQHMPEYLHSFNKNNKNMAKFTRKHNSTYVQFKKAYNKAVANFIDPAALASEGIGDYLGIGLGGLAGAEIGRAGSAQIKAKALRRSADPNERHNQMLAAQLEAAQQLQDPVQRARAIEKAKSQADYESAKLQRWAGLKGNLLQAGYTGLGATTGLLGNTIAHNWNN